MFWNRLIKMNAHALARALAHTHLAGEFLVGQRTGAAASEPLLNCLSLICMPVCVCVCVCIHPYITYKYAYMHVYIRTYIHTCMCTYIHTCTDIGRTKQARAQRETDRQRQRET